MARNPIWRIEARCDDSTTPSLNIEIAARSGVEALAAAVAELIADNPRLKADPLPTEVPRPAHVTVTSHGRDLWTVKCRCGAIWDTVKRSYCLRILTSMIPTHHDHGQCEDRWPQNRPATVEPVNKIGAKIREARESNGMTQAELAEHAGCSPATISAAEVAAGRVSDESLRRITDTLNRLGS